MYDTIILPKAKRLEVQCNDMMLSLPHLTPWNATTANRCTFDEIFSYWKDNNTLTFLVGLDICHPSLYTFLDQYEKEKELRYKTTVSRKRFVVSRSIIKHILKRILPVHNLSDIVLIRKKHGRILVKDFPEIYISLSYSGTCIAITVGKQKIGSDIEGIRPVDIRKIKSYPLFNDSRSRNEKERSRNFFHMWTLIEAYAKLYDRSTYPCLIEKELPRDVNFVSYCINTTSILSLAFGQESGKDALFWLDTAGVRISS